MAPHTMLAATIALIAAPAAGDPPVVAPAAGDPPVVAVRIIPAAPAPSPAAVQQPLVCKSSVETGSLIKRNKRCLTKAQWRYVDDVQRQQTQRLIDDNRDRPPGDGGICGTFICKP